MPLPVPVPPAMHPLNVTLQVFPKAPKLQASQATLARQDTIDEGGEVDSSPPSRDSRVVIDGGASTNTTTAATVPTVPALTPGAAAGAIVPVSGGAKERNLAMERERQIEMASSRATTSDTYDTGLRETPPTLAQRDLIATVLDMKVDVRLELQRMQQRIGRIEDLLGELVKRLAPQVDSSGQTTPGDEICAGCGAGGGAATSSVPTTPATATATTPVDTVITISSPTATGGGGGGGSGNGVGSVPATTASAGAGSGLLNPSVQLVSSAGGNGLGPLMLKKRRSKSRKAPAPPKQAHAGSGMTSVQASASVPAASTAATSPVELLHLRLLEEDFSAAQQLQQQQQQMPASATVTPTGTTPPSILSGTTGATTPTTTTSAATTPTGSGRSSKREFL